MTRMSILDPEKKRLSEALGDQAWRDSGLGAPADIDAPSGVGRGNQRAGGELRRQAWHWALARRQSTSSRYGSRRNSSIAGP